MQGPVFTGLWKRLLCLSRFAAVAATLSRVPKKAAAVPKEVRIIQAEKDGAMTDSTNAAPLANDEDLFSGYKLGSAYDEMFEAPGRPRPHYQALYRRLKSLTPDEFRRRKAMTDLSMLSGRRRLHRLSAGRGHRARLADGPRAADHSGRRSGHTSSAGWCSG